MATFTYVAVFSRRQQDFYKSTRFGDDRLNQKHERMSAGELSDLLETLAITVTDGRQNQETRLAALHTYMENAPTVEG